MPRVLMHVDGEIGRGKPALTEARVRVKLKSGRSLVREAHGARGYPANPASDQELAAKFLDCAGRSLRVDSAGRVLAALAALERLDKVDRLGLTG
jgi:hypothetical protein